jgi:hypothetical protein
VRRLPSQSESELASTLQSLLPGERGWIALGDAARIFSDKELEYAFGEMDEEGNGKLARFAAERRCGIRIMPMEDRVYFRPGRLKHIRRSLSVIPGGGTALI